MISLALLILTFPTDFELYRERNGEDPKKKGRSMTVRALLMSVCALGAAWILGLTWLVYFKCLLLSFAIFFLFFDYAVILILVHRGIVELPKGEKWYTYLSKSPLDKLFAKVNWKVRMGIRVIVFITAIIIWIS